MKKILIVVDMQNDFIDGALGTAEAVSIVPYVKEVIESFDGKVFFTRDTHFDNYMQTEEGKNLPVPHCITGKSLAFLAPTVREQCFSPTAPSAAFSARTERFPTADSELK